MNNLIIAILIFAAIGFSAMVVTNVLNRDIVNLQRAAKKIVQERAQRRQMRSSNALIDFCVSKDVDGNKVRILLEHLLALFGCKILRNSLGEADLLKDLLRVQRIDIAGFDGVCSS